MGQTIISEPEYREFRNLLNDIKKKLIVKYGPRAVTWFEK